MTDQDELLSPAERIRAVELRREERAKKHRELWDVQRAIDQEEFDKLEESHGPEQVHTISFNQGWSPGVPTMVVFRTPSRLEIKRFLNKGDAKNPDKMLSATHDLCVTLVLYPTMGVLQELMERFCNLPATVANAASDIASGEFEGQKKA